MTTARVTEISASSPTSFDAAIHEGIDRASKTIRNLKSAWVHDQKISIENGKIVEYRINMKVSFVLDD